LTFFNTTQKYLKQTVLLYRQLNLLFLKILNSAVRQNWTRFEQQLIIYIFKKNQSLYSCLHRIKYFVFLNVINYKLSVLPILSNVAQILSREWITLQTNKRCQLDGLCFPLNLHILSESLFWLHLL
jgi:hypothetical protein